MKKIICVAVILLVSGGVALASADKNRSAKGKGAVCTGSTAQGQASQLRAGR